MKKGGRPAQATDFSKAKWLLKLSAAPLKRAFFKEFRARVAFTSNRRGWFQKTVSSYQ
jgi:hypothetical protein